jgi:hypothetical protein
VTVVIRRAAAGSTSGVPGHAVASSPEDSDRTGLSRHFRTSDARVGHQHQLSTAIAESSPMTSLCRGCSRDRQLSDMNIHRTS